MFTSTTADRASPALPGADTPPTHAVRPRVRRRRSPQRGRRAAHCMARCWSPYGPPAAERHASSAPRAAARVVAETPRIAAAVVSAWSSSAALAAPSSSLPKAPESRRVHPPPKLRNAAAAIERLDWPAVFVFCYSATVRHDRGRPESRRVRRRRSCGLLQQPSGAPGRSPAARDRATRPSSFIFLCCLMWTRRLLQTGHGSRLQDPRASEKRLSPAAALSKSGTATAPAAAFSKLGTAAAPFPRRGRRKTPWPRRPQA